MGEDGEVCAICLDVPLTRNLTLPCRHAFHADCLLASFLGETPGLWKCPCCRACILMPRPATSSKTPTGAITASCPREIDQFLHDPNNPTQKVHSYRLGTSQWVNLQSFLSAATDALEEETSNEKSLSTLKNPLKKKGKSFISNMMRLLELCCPPAALSITAFAGHSRVQRLMDPSAPNPSSRAVRYFLTVLGSIMVAAAFIWVLGIIMEWSGIIVCDSVDALVAFFSSANRAPSNYSSGASTLIEVCLPMVPDGLLLPIGFGVLGLYIAVQVAWLYGVQLRHVLLRWDEAAPSALGCWMAVCLGYTLFVYVARFLLTLLLAFTGPMPTCLPTVDNPSGDCR